MQVQLNMTGLDKLKAQFAAMSERSKNLHEGLHEAGGVALKAAQNRINSGGPGWAPNQSGNPLLNRTGQLLNSLTFGASFNIERYVGDDTVEVGTSVPYARYMQEGTGIYGPKGQRIVPTTAKVMAFDVGGSTVFARSTAGSPARAFLLLDEETDAKIANKLKQFIVMGPTDG